jgi:sulfopropanediol 3-dehydrogenase
MAFGTSQLKPVDMVAGPGNQYVVEAKRQLFGTVGIDFIPGPTEILIIADESQEPELVAADILAQCEHGMDSKATLITTSGRLGIDVAGQIEAQLKTLPTAATAGKCWEQSGEIVVAESREDAVSLADQYASEHVQIMTKDPSWFFDRLHNFGTVFVGEFASTVYSDKAIGPNHILPTGRGGRYTGGLWVGKYLKNVTYQRMTKEGSIPVASVAANIARAEGMIGHAISAEKRIAKYDGKRNP